MRPAEQRRVVDEDGLFPAVVASRDVSPVQRAWPATGEHGARRSGEPAASGSQRQWRRAETERVDEETSWRREKLGVWRMAPETGSGGT